MPSIGRVLCCVSPRGLAFSLPCLSRTECNYVTTQLNLLTGNCPSPITGPGYRFDGIAGAYGLDSKVTDSRKFKMLCERATHERRYFNKIDMIRPHQVQRGLEFGAMLGDPNIWIKEGSAKKTNYNYNKTLEVVQSKKEYDFTNIYLARLGEVLNRLGLQDSELDMEIWSRSDYNTFSSEFYDKFLKEICGVNVQYESKKILNKWRYGKSLRMDKDPINLIRTYYLLKEILDVDLDMNLKFVALLGRISALEILVTMNVLFWLTDAKLEEGLRKELVLNMDVDKFESLYVESQVVWDLSLPQCRDILTSIGFTQYEVTKLIFETQPYLITDIQKKVCSFDNNLETYINIMSKRVELLKREGFKLGIADVSAMFKFLNNWERVMDAIDKAEIEKNLCFVKFSNNTNYSTIKVGNLPIKKKTGSISRLFLLQYLDIREREEVKEFDNMFKRIPNAKDVPLKVIIDSLELLEGLNFSKEQIRKGFHIAFYPKNILEKEIARVDSNLGIEWMEKDNALVLLNYFIELENGLEFDLIYQGILDHFRKGVSFPEFKELSIEE